MPQQSLTRRTHEITPSSSGAKYASNQPASPAVTQAAQQSAGTGREADLFSGSQTQNYTSDVYANVPVAVPSLANDPTRPVRESSLIPGEPHNDRFSLGPEGTSATVSKTHIAQFSPLHPFLRQQNSATNKLKKLAAADDMDVKPMTNPEKSRYVQPQEDLPPHHVHHHTFTRVGSLRKFYDVPSATLPFYPFRRRQETANPQKRAVSGVFASSTSPGFIGHNNPAEESGLRRSTASAGNARDEAPFGGGPEDTARRSRNRLRKKKQQPTLKEKVSMFESLNRPPSRLQMLRTRAKSFETTAVLKRGGEEVTNGFRKMAENGTRMWRRLSGSFDKEREKHAVDAIDEPADSPDKPSSFKVLSSDIDQHTYPQSRRPVIPPRRTPRRESTFLLTEPTSRIPRAVAHTPHSRVSVPSNSHEASDSSTSEVRDFAVDGNTESMRLRPRTSHPVLPTLDFDVDGVPDMLRYFERNFDINLSVHERGTTIALGTKHPQHPSHHDSRHRSTVTTPRRLPHRDSRSTNRSSHTSSISRPSLRSYSNNPPPAIPPRHPGRTRGPSHDSPSTLSRKSHRASPVLSIHEARGDTRVRPRQPDSARKRRKPAMSAAGASQQRVWDVRRDTPRLGVVRSEEEMIYTARPAGLQEENRGRGKGMIQLGNERPGILAEKEGEADERRQDENVVVAEAQCGLAHPRPSRVLNLKRFVEFVREKSGALSKL